jgi:methionyl-tRNA formyltransferase
MTGPASAVVFGYHNVGVRCLRVLLDAGVDVRLVVSHDDSPTESIWFDSVAALAAERGLPCIAPADANAPTCVDRVRAANCDFLFSFYYRRMLGPELLDMPRRGAFNMHGSLLPKYRGRAPVNWAILSGERETGATLHVMDSKPDHGAIVDQLAVPILQDDQARLVFDKVTLAAEIVLARSLPRLIAGTAVLQPQTHQRGQYFGSRRPEDGRIPSSASAVQIHNLVRAVAPPEYPGAFFDAAGVRIVLRRTLLQSAAAAAHTARAAFTLHASQGALWLDAADGARLRVMAATIDGKDCTAADFITRFGATGIAPAA